MTPTTHLRVVTSREADAERIAAAAEVVRAIDFLDDAPHAIGVTLDAYSNELEVDVHGCSPAELEAVRMRWPEATARHDHYAAPRWVEVVIGLVTISFYRQ